jgi:hypothetical protein
MMRRYWLAFSLFWAGPLAAQTIVRPDAPLDPARAAVRDALLVFRDSLNTIDGAAGRLQRDFRQASALSLVSRARVMQQACARSLRAVPPTRKAVLNAPLSNARQNKERTNLVAAINHLNSALGRCESEFATMSRPDQGETVRGYANDRAVRLQAELRRYESALRGFLGIMGIKFPPLDIRSASAAG